MGDSFGGTPNPLNPGVKAREGVSEIFNGAASGAEARTTPTPRPEPKPEPKPEPVSKPEPKPEPMPARIPVINNIRRRRHDGVMDIQLPRRKRITEQILPDTEMDTREFLEQLAPEDDDFDELGDSEMGVVTNLDGSAPEEAVDPTNREMAAVPTIITKKPRRLRKSYIVAMLLSLLVAAGCGVAALLILIDNNNTDYVAKAVGKIVDGEVWNNLVLDGTIEITMPKAAVTPETEREVSSLRMSLQGALIKGSGANSINTSTNVALRNGNNYVLEVDEIYGTRKDLFVKIKGAAELLRGLSGTEIIENAETEEPNGEEVIEGEIVEEVAEEEIADGTEAGDVSALEEAWLKAFEIVDGNWVRIPADASEQIAPESAGEVACTKDLMKGIGESGSKIRELYRDNEFIVSSEKNDEIEKKRNQVYAVQFDETRLTNFIAGMVELVPVTDFMKCMGMDTEKFDAKKIVEAIADGPEFYAEVDDNFSLTRVYMKKEFADGMRIVIDFSFAEPLNLNISDPDNYMEAVELVTNGASEETEVPDTAEEVVEGVYEEPVYEEEWVPEEVYEEPVYEEPVYEEPVYEEPIYEEPIYEEPIYEEPEG